MSEMTQRKPLRPLGHILSARANGEDTRLIERQNIRERSSSQTEHQRQHVQGRLFVLGVSFLCLFLALGVKIGMLSASEPTEPRSQRAGASIVAQRANIVDREGRLLATNMDTYSLFVETKHLVDPKDPVFGGGVE